ncbi:hypothetical protein GW17_00030233 [Ensete ventricosum]|nr:hypothetical protein GW17_00030233 [Ensete ventricosum]RZS12079.1 hypothetical protein BHM03_00043489 [Ensete ventricosum]
MASTAAAVPFWRAAGMTYITYSNICASLVRGCLKEPYRSDAGAREKVHFAVSKWANGKPEKKLMACTKLTSIWFEWLYHGEHERVNDWISFWGI